MITLIHIECDAKTMHRHNINEHLLQMNKKHICYLHVSNVSAFVYGICRPTLNRLELIYLRTLETHHFTFTVSSTWLI